MSRTRAALFGLLGSLSLLVTACGQDAPALQTKQTSPVTSPYATYANQIEQAEATAYASVHVTLPTKAGSPAPALPADAFGTGLGSHVVLGFLPSWELADVSSVDYADLSEVAYYTLQVEPHGTLFESGPGWDGLEGGSVDTMVTDAHAASVRALLTLFTETPKTLREIASDPVSSGEGLADRVAPILTDHHFDGVDLDFEGNEAEPRAGFTKFVAAFSKRMRTLNSTWSIVLNTFPQAAVDPESMYDVKALAPYVDQLFVMAYDMSDLEVPGATAPLVGADLSVATSLASYVTTVPPSKVVLGIPFYGYDFPATRPEPPSLTIGHADAVTYDDVVAAARPALWDPGSQTPFSSFRLGRRWHQTWFEDPVSVALKVALASAFKTGGVGAWDLGMASGQPQMTGTLDGGSAPTRLALATEPQ